MLSRSLPMGGGKADNRAFISLSWFPYGSGHSVSTSHDTRTQASQVQWHYSPANNVNALETDVAVDRSPSFYGVRAEADYSGYRFDARVSHTSTLGRGQGSPDSHRTNIMVGTAVAFADGHVGISRPISDSFALVTPHQTLRKHTVEVNAGAVSPDAKTDFLGPAVLPDLNAYYRYQILLNANDLPDGLNLGRDFFTLQPGYHSGTVIPAGDGATVLLEANLVDFAGQPLYLELGSIRLEAAPKSAPVEFFTNRQGRLRVLGVMPGKITIALANYPEIPVTVDIPRDTVGVYNAGTIQLLLSALPIERER
jgi:outer membrane usher protein